MKIIIKGIFLIIMFITFIRNLKQFLNNFFYSSLLKEKVKINKIIIGIDIYKNNEGRGPDTFVEGLNKVLNQIIVFLFHL